LDEEFDMRTAFSRRLFGALSAAALLACTLPGTASAEPKKDFKLAWSIYVGWVPWQYAEDSGILKKWADKYGLTIDVVQINDYVESINQFTAGQFDAVTLTNGETKMLGPVVGKDGAPGRDGADGLGFEDMSFDFDDAGRPVATFSRGDVVKSVRLPCIIDRGVYKPDAAYLKGDAVSYGGSLWIAQKDAPEGRPDGSPDWRLAVKKGRDGRDVEAKKVL